MSNFLQELLNKELSRKEFIGMLGMGLVSVIGISSVIKNLTDSIGINSKITKSSEVQYGETLYGGNKPIN